MDVHSENSGFRIVVTTTQPAVQFYTGNHRGGNVGKEGVVYEKRSGFCLETQNFPDAINHDNFPNAILKVGEHYEEITKYRFSICA